MGVLCSHVDDFFYGGIEKFQKEVIGEFIETLEVESNETIKFRDIGVGLKQEEEAIIMDQKTNIEGIKTV